MTATNILGYLMILAPFLAIAVFIIKTEGAVVALKIFGLTAVLFAFIYAGIQLSGLAP